MRRWVWMVPTALLVAVVIGVTAVWYFAVQQMRDALADWVAARRADGWTISATAPAAGGWPVTATLTLRDFELRGGSADIPHGLSWRADELVLELAPDNPHELRIETFGLQHLRVADAPDIAYSAASLLLLVPLQASPQQQPLELRGSELRARIPVGTAEDTLTTTSLVVHAVLDPAAPRGRAAVSLSLAADGITLPSQDQWPLGPRIESLALQAAMNGPLSNAPSLRERVTAWRNGGGILDLQHFETHWGPLGLNGKGTLGLDPQLQPSGSGTAEVTGYATTVDALVRHGALSASAAVTAKAMLSLLAVTPRDGGATEVEVPLSVQNDTLSMHQIPLLRLPQLDWPPS